MMVDDGRVSGRVSGHSTHTGTIPPPSPSHLTLHCITLSRVRFTLGLWVILLYSFINDFEIYLNYWQLIAR